MNRDDTALTIVPDKLPSIDSKQQRISNPSGQNWFKDNAAESPVTSEVPWGVSGHLKKWIRIHLDHDSPLYTAQRQLKSATVPVQVSFKPSGEVAVAKDFSIIQRKSGRWLRFLIDIPLHTPGPSNHLKLKLGLDDGRMKAVPEIHLIDNHYIPVRVGIAPPAYAKDIIVRIPMPPMGLINTGPIDASVAEPCPALESEVADV